METGENFIKNALGCLQKGDAQGAIKELENALRINDEDEEALFALSCVHWCLEKLISMKKNDSPYEKAYYISAQWKNFCLFAEKLRKNKAFPHCTSAIGHFLSSAALEYFTQVEKDGDLRHDPPLLLQTGVCYKRVGNYDKALEYLQKAVSYMENNGEALAEYADVHALLGDERSAKLLFREAFYIDPHSVALYSLEAQLIVSLIENIRALGVNRYLNEWLPVYAALLGVFSIKRELKLAEAGKLKQSIFNLENDLRNNADDMERLIPILLNKYLWLLDYYENSDTEPAAINEVLLKIKLTAPDIYSRYIKIQS